MTDRIKFLMQEAIDLSDSAGGFTKNWIDRGYVWGTLGRTSGNSGAYDGQSRQFTQTQVELTDAKGSGLTIGWRLFAGDQIYEVIGVLSDNAAHSVLLLRSATVDVL